MNRFNDTLANAYKIFEVISHLAVLGIDEQAYETVYLWIHEAKTDLYIDDITYPQQLVFWDKAIEMLDAARIYKEKRLTK